MELGGGGADDVEGPGVVEEGRGFDRSRPAAAFRSPVDFRFKPDMI